MSKINCAMCTSFAKAFFSQDLSCTTKDYIYEHLLECKDCLRVYKKVAKELGLEFHLKASAVCFVIEVSKGKYKNCCNKTKAILDAMGMSNEIDLYKHKYILAADSMNLEVLQNLKCVNDMLQESFDFSNDETLEEDIKSVREYAKFMAKKFCKTLDYLEDCYNAEFKR